MSDYETYHGDHIALGDPSAKAVPITPDIPLDTIPRFIWVGNGGNLVCKLGDQDDFVLFASVAAGSILPFRVRLVKDDETTCSNIIALY